jgi:16S rRNA (adenine1518-N6/adenine1519-N6)-dimethyltransferase
MSPYRFKPKKSLGQHYLVDQQVLASIIEAAKPLKDCLIVEVGPGQGVMTNELLENGAEVVAVEKDDFLAPELRKRFVGNKLTVVHADILEVNLGDLLEGRPYRVVANIPYYLTGRLFRYFFEDAPRPTELLLLIQKEVAERLTAKPGDMSLLGLAAQLHSKPKKLFDVPSKAFHPRPRVTSALVQLKLKPEPDPLRREIMTLARFAFAERRKQLHNTLKAGLQLSEEQTSSLLAAAKVKGTARPQELALSDWKHLAEKAKKQGIFS